MPLGYTYHPAPDVACRQRGRRQRACLLEYWYLLLLLLLLLQSWAAGALEAAGIERGKKILDTVLQLLGLPTGNAVLQ